MPKKKGNFMSVTRPVNNPTPFASGSTQINTIPQTTTTNGAASMSAGFPPETMMAITSGGIPPDGKDFNGIFNQLSQHQVFLNAGGQYQFDATLASEIGGYPLGAVVQSNDGLSAYVSTVANNSHDPNTDTTGWEAFAGAALLVAGNDALAAEITRAEAAENALSGAISNEASIRSTNDNTLLSNINAEVTRAEAAEALLAPLASPALTGSPTAPTQTAGDNSTKLATTAFANNLLLAHLGSSGFGVPNYIQIGALVNVTEGSNITFANGFSVQPIIIVGLQAGSMPSGAMTLGVRSQSTLGFTLEFHDNNRNPLTGNIFYIAIGV